MNKPCDNCVYKNSGQCSCEQLDKYELYIETYNQALDDFEKCAIQQSSYTETEEGWSGMTIDTKVIKSIKEQLKK